MEENEKVADEKGHRRGTKSLLSWLRLQQHQCWISSSAGARQRWVKGKAEKHVRQHFCACRGSGNVGFCALGLPITIRDAGLSVKFVLDLRDGEAEAMPRPIRKE